MKTFFTIVLIILALITAWNTMEFWFYSQDVNALRKDVDQIQEQIKQMQGLKDPAKPPDHPPPLNPTTPVDPIPTPDKPPLRPDTGGNGPYYNDNWGWCRELQKADPAFKC